MTPTPTKPDAPGENDYVTLDQAKEALRWAKSVINGGYASGSDANIKRKNMKVIYKLAKVEFQRLKRSHCPEIGENRDDM